MVWSSIALCPAKEIVKRHKHAQNEPGTPIEEPQPEDISVEKAERKAKRQFQVQAFEHPFSAKGGSDRALFQALIPKGCGDMRFPVRVAIVLLDPGVDARIGVVQHIVMQEVASPGQDNVLVDFIVSGIGAGRLDSFVASFLPPKQAHVPTWIETTVPNPFAEKEEPAVDEVSIDFRTRYGDGDFPAQLRGNVLIGVHDQDPFVPERQVGNRPILFLGKDPIEFELDDLCSPLLRNLDG